jgi:hypothetical protein
LTIKICASFEAVARDLPSDNVSLLFTDIEAIATVELEDAAPAKVPKPGSAARCAPSGSSHRTDGSTGRSEN